MTKTKMTMAELPVAVAIYAASGYDPVAMKPLMDLLQQQTDYYQKRFWTLVVKMYDNKQVNEIVATLNNPNTN